jgi:predicted glycosyltransferase
VRVLVHVQHLSGAGHYVRAFEIANALAEAHDVVLVEGGFHVPRRPSHPRLHRVALPATCNGVRGLEPTDPERDLASVRAERRVRLCETVSRWAPDAVLVEHYPFGKWELEDEILATLEAAREANPAVVVSSSLRDVCRQTRREDVGSETYAERVLDRLNGRFDALFVHGDPTVTRIEEHFPLAGRIDVPVVYTGYVSESVPDRAAGATPSATSAPYAVASTGAGGGDDDLLFTCVEAWKRLERAGALRGRSLLVYTGLRFGEAPRERLRRETAAGPFSLREFGLDFLGRLAGADLSISHAGYNTCVNLLETRRRAVLVPDARMSDQTFRARRFEDLGLATCIDPRDLTSDRLAEAVMSTLSRPPPRHRVHLDGARRTRAAIEGLVAATRAPSL